VTSYVGHATRQPSAALARRRVSSPSRARRRPHPAGVLLAAVLLTLMVGLIYLAQTIHLAATNYQVEQLLRERDDIARQVQTLETTMLRWGAEPLVLERGQQAGLDPLGARLRVPTR
jgi:type VI protein secretion system component VasK